MSDPQIGILYVIGSVLSASGFLGVALAIAATFLEMKDDEAEPEPDDEPCLADGTPIYPKRKLSRVDYQEGLAARGTDSWEEARWER